MSDRETKEGVVERRQRVRLFLAVSVLASDAALKTIAEKLQVGEKKLRSDLEAIRDEIEHGPSDELTEDLTKTIEATDTFRQLKVLGKRVMKEMVKGTIDRALGSALIEAIREQRQVLIRERDESSETAITALEILTPQEQEALRKYRESKTPPGLKPGEFPAPPEGAVLPGSSSGVASTPSAAPRREDEDDGEPS